MNTYLTALRTPISKQPQIREKRHPPKHCKEIKRDTERITINKQTENIQRVFKCMRKRKFKEQCLHVLLHTTCNAERTYTCKEPVNTLTRLKNKATPDATYPKSHTYTHIQKKHTHAHTRTFPRPTKHETTEANMHTQLANTHTHTHTRYNHHNSKLTSSAQMHTGYGIPQGLKQATKCIIPRSPSQMSTQPAQRNPALTNTNPPKLFPTETCTSVQPDTDKHDATTSQKEQYTHTHTHTCHARTHARTHTHTHLPH